MEAAAPAAEEGVPPATFAGQLAALGDRELRARVLELGVTPAQLGEVMLADDGPDLQTTLREALINLATKTAAPLTSTAEKAIAARLETQRAEWCAPATVAGAVAEAAADPRAAKSAAEWRSLRGDRPTKESLIHITFSTQFKDGAFERSIEAGEALRRFGCFSFYNPNTDCPDTRTQAQKDAGAPKGASNWLEEFRTSLKRSRATCGFVWQLQPDQQRERSSMQVAEQEMAMEVERRGVPVVGTYAEPDNSDITCALDIALRQWEAGQFVEEALPSERHGKNIDDAALRRLVNVERHPALRRLTTLDLNTTQITDAAPLAALVGLTKLDLGDTPITDAAPLAALEGLRELDLNGTQIADAAPLAALMGLTNLDLRYTKIADAAPLAALVGLTHLYLNDTQIAESDATVAALRARGVKVYI
eukprot:COSAG01_NODE_11779_length_1860_cov_3.831346_1_plen_421_part_00